MNRLPIKILTEVGVEPPAYETDGAAGFDFSAHIPDDCGFHVLRPGQRKLIKTGIKMAIPKGFELQVRPRSGLAYKHGISVVNSPGTIDSDYRGDIGIILINHGQEDFAVADGDRIAQGVVKSVSQADFEVVESLDETERGEGGFGHTGT